MLGFVVGAAVAGGGLLLYQHTRGAGAHGSADLPAAPAIETGKRVSAAPAHPAVRSAPFGSSEEVFEAGATLYAARCASCHGRPNHDAGATSKQGQQFWNRKDTSAAALVAQPAGELYARIAAGAPARNMPAYAQVLSDRELWDLTLLLKSSRGELPDPVLRLLKAKS